MWNNNTRLSSQRNLLRSLFKVYSEYKTPKNRYPVNPEGGGPNKRRQSGSGFSLDLLYSASSRSRCCSSVHGSGTSRHLMYAATPLSAAAGSALPVRNCAAPPSQAVPHQPSQQPLQVDALHCHAEPQTHRRSVSIRQGCAHWQQHPCCCACLCSGTDVYSGALHLSASALAGTPCGELDTFPASAANGLFAATLGLQCLQAKVSCACICICVCLLSALPPASNRASTHAGRQSRRSHMVTAQAPHPDALTAGGRGARGHM